MTETPDAIARNVPGYPTRMEGAARIEFDDGPVLELTAGDIASLPAGAHTTWYLTTPFKEFWVITPGAPAPR